MKKTKSFLLSVLLSGVCLVASSMSVLAGNQQSVIFEKTTVKNIFIKLNFLRRKILFETTGQLLMDLKSIFDVLKNSKNSISFEDRNSIAMQIMGIIGNLKITSVEDEKSCYELSRQADYMRSPAAPKILPMEFLEIEKIEELNI